MSTFRDAAALYVGLGWQIFPLAEGTKVPAIKRGQGFKQATDDFDTIEGWDRAFPRANIGIATGKVSGITVIDVDPRNDGHVTMNQLAMQGYLLPWTPEARTGNNGRHLFFAYHPEIKASKNRLGPGIDVKTDGGYVVGVPSRIDASEQGSGGEYRWINEPDNKGLPPLPAWLVMRLQPPPERKHNFEPVQSNHSAERSLEGMAATLANSGTGNRNNLLNWCAYRAGLLVSQGRIGEHVVRRRLIEAGLACGLLQRDIEATISSGLRAAQRGGRE